MTNRKVAYIVKDHKPLVLTAHETVQHACLCMRERRAGSVLVIDEQQRLSGIFTGRDAVRMLAEGKDAAVTTLAQAMTPDQLEQYGFEEFQKLQKVYGNTLEDRLHQVALMVHDLEQKRPGLKQLLKAMGLETRLLLCHNSSRRRNAITRGRGAKRPPVLVDSGHAGPGNRPEKISLPFSLIF